MENLVTTDTILDWLQEQVEQKQPVTPTKSLEIAQKLNVLLGDEHDHLYKLEQEVAKAKLEMLSKGDKSVARAEIEVQATDLFRTRQNQKARIGRIEEMIRISKRQATLKSEEFGNY